MSADAPATSPAGVPCSASVSTGARGSEFDVSWEGIPFGGAYLHLVRAAEGDDRVGRWAVVVDYHRSSDRERILPASAFQHDQLPPRAALELGAALFTSLVESASGLEAPRWPGRPQLRPDPPPRVRQVGPGLSRAAPLADDGSYRAPERTVGARSDAASSVYTGAAVVLELLVGRPLGLADTTSAEELDALIEQGLVEAWRHVGRSTATNTSIALLGAALATLPDHRPSPKELAEALAEAIAEQPGEGLADFLRRVVTTPAPRPVSSPRGRERRPPAPRGGPSVPLFEVVAAGAALLGALVAMFVAILVVLGLAR
jgi:hypothetical protein